MSSAGSLWAQIARERYERNLSSYGITLSDAISIDQLFFIFRDWVSAPSYHYDNTTSRMYIGTYPEKWSLWILPRGCHLLAAFLTMPVAGFPARPQFDTCVKRPVLISDVWRFPCFEFRWNSCEAMWGSDLIHNMRTIAGKVEKTNLEIQTLDHDNPKLLSWSTPLHFHHCRHYHHHSRRNHRLPCSLELLFLFSQSSVVFAPSLLSLPANL